MVYKCVHNNKYQMKYREIANHSKTGTLDLNENAKKMDK